MKHKVIGLEERIYNLINMAFGLEMIRSILECKFNDSEARKEAEEINREISRTNKRIQKLMQSDGCSTFK